MGDLISRKEHKIKIKKRYYDAVLKGEKTFEIRKNDRDYNVGDIINFIPIADDCDMILPHNQTSYKVTYVFHGGEYGLEEGYCVFGIAPVESDPKWIPCSERLPEEYDYPEQRYRVLVSCSDGIVRNATIKSMLSGEKHFCLGYEFVYEAWMPLPEPYQQI